MEDNYIRVRGARQKNLQNLDVDIPRDKLVIMTGLSGSGNRRSLLIRCMRRGSADMWSRCHLMRECSLELWISQM